MISIIMKAMRTCFQENAVIISQEIWKNIYIDSNAHDNNVSFLLIFNVVAHQLMKLIWTLNPFKIKL